MPPGGVTDARRLYSLYETVLTTIDDFAARENVGRAMPSPVAPALEFPIERSIIAPVRGADQLYLPASNTYQKQIAAAHQGPVYCIAPCYRQDEHLPVGVDRLNVFHQIEFELPGAPMETAREMTSRLLTQLWAQVERAGFDVPRWSFALEEAIDLAARSDAPLTLPEYDAWALELAERIDGPVWILHTPRTPPPRLNRDFDHPGPAQLTLGFDLVTPAGELLSGGERDTDETRRLYTGDATLPGHFSTTPPWLEGLQLGSSGFGIGLERMLRAMTGAEMVRDVVLPHCIDGRV